MFAHDISHTGHTSDSAISSSNVNTLGVAWQANTGDASYSSPVVGPTASGQALVFVGNQLGTLTAYDAATGARVWTYQAAAAIEAPPTVANGIVYVGSADKKLYAIDAADGTLRCSFTTTGLVESPPLVVDPDGNGATVYFGDVGPDGADDGGHMWAMHAVDPNSATDCSTRWSFRSFGQPPDPQSLAGVWAPPAYATDTNGRPLVIVGSSSPDDAVYAFDARTGARVWRFQTEQYTDSDVGAGATISPPGANGFADGVAYVPGKDNIVYALNLRTGAKIWEFRIRDDAPLAGGEARSTAVLDGRTLYLGYGAGLYALDAVTGAKVWRSQDLGVSTAEIIAAPAETGTGSSAVLLAGDRVGRVRAFRASTGAIVWSHLTGNTVYSSAAISDGTVYVSSADGFLYAYKRGGADPSRPDTSIANPHDDTLVPNPNGTLTVTGGATGASPISKVKIALKDVNQRRWWNATTHTWSRRFTENDASLTNPGQKGTYWSWPYAVPFDGGRYTVQATAVDNAGRRDAIPAVSRFAIESLGNPATATITSPTANQTIVFPGGVPQTFNVTISGTASDSGGNTPGVAYVFATVENIDHGEWFCGAPGCNRFGPSPWTGDYRTFQATLANPGAVSTSWSIVMPTYDHPHAYQATVWAQDRDGHVQQLRKPITFCVKTASGPCP
ncbi:MAG: eukaryotic-like serine/threonine-protein kinase [Actinomycetota bacterium]|nr:eukaryotic-like serine/threonine-protein kinase [Actinomycetota bacterium]